MNACVPSGGSCGWHKVSCCYSQGFFLYECYSTRFLLPFVCCGRRTATPFARGKWLLKELLGWNRLQIIRKRSILRRLPFRTIRSLVDHPSVMTACTWRKRGRLQNRSCSFLNSCLWFPCSPSLLLVVVSKKKYAARCFHLSEGIQKKICVDKFSQGRHIINIVLSLASVLVCCLWC